MPLIDNRSKFMSAFIAMKQRRNDDSFIEPQPKTTKECFKKLQERIPALNRRQRVSRLEIITHAAEYIRYLNHILSKHRSSD